MTLPAADAAPTPKIMIVEDNEANLKLFRDILEAHGHVAVCATDGASALELLEEHRPEIVLMDIQLPDRSGLEIITWMRETEQHRNARIIAITAFAMNGDAERIMKSGCDDYISKPISISSFMSMIDRHVGDVTAAVKEAQAT